MVDFTKTAEEVLNERQRKAQQYTFLNEALFKLKDPEYTSPYENIGRNDTQLFNRQEIQDIYDNLSPMYKNFADNGDPNENWKKEAGAVKLATVFGTDYETAKSMINIYYPMYAERDLKEKGYGTRLWNSIQSAFYNDMMGYNTTIGVWFDNEAAKKRAEEYYEKMMKIRNWQDYGAFGNFFLDNMQGLYSMGKMALLTALTSGVGNALGATANVIKGTSFALNTLDSGATQMGSNAFMMSKMTDENGNPLFDMKNITPSEKAIFTLGVGLMGAIETMEFEYVNKILPKSIRNSIATARASKVMNTALLKQISLNGAKTSLFEFAKNTTKNMVGEGIEEVLQQMVGNFIESYEAELQNSRGANFENLGYDDLWESFWGGVKGSALASILSVGTGTLLNNRSIRKAQDTLKQYQRTTDTSTTVFNDYIDTRRYNFSNEEIQTRVNEIKQNKVNPIQTYKSKTNFGLYADADGALTLKALETINPSLNVAEVEIADKVVHDISTEQKRERFARQFKGRLSSQDTTAFYFNNEEELNTAKETIKNMKGTTLNEDNSFTVATLEGDKTFSLKLQEPINEDFSKIDNYIKENKLAKTEIEADALNSFLKQIYNITKKDKTDANLDDFLSSINIITDSNSKASIDIATELNKNGYRQATIHLTKDSTFNSITHEFNHYLQNNASIEDLKGFEIAYNIDLSNRDIWNKEISKKLRNERKIKTKNYTYAELFANDAIKYYRQGTAENVEMKSFFSKMKNALKGLVDFARAKFLNKKTIEAFDKLFSNKEQIENNSLINKTNDNGIITYYETEEEIDKTKSKYNNKKEKNYGQQEYQPTDEFRRIQEESRRLLNKFKTTERTYKELDEGLRRRYSGYIQNQLQPTKCGYTYGNEFNLTNKHNITFTLCSEVNSQLFHDAFETIKPYLIQNELVDLHDNYKNSKCFLSRDGLQGFAIEDNGNLISVFNADTTKRGYLDAIKNFVKEQGATHLDCYGYLAEKYNKYFGFKTASLMDYNLDYDHHNIAKNYNSPQVAFMVNTTEEVETKHFNKDQYDEAQTWQLHYVNKDSKIIYYETEENSNNFIHTKEDVEEIKNKDWLLPPREEIKEVDEEIADIYNTIDIQKASGFDLIEEARKIRESYELLEDTETDVNGILTEEEKQQLKETETESVDTELYRIFKERIEEQLENKDNIKDLDKVLRYAWELADITTESEEDTKFIYTYASDYEGLFNLIDILNKANTKFENGTLIQNYNDYGDIAEDILELKKTSPKARLREALTTIQNEPRTYRIAFEDAIDILNNTAEKREYYRSIKNDLLDYLGKKENTDTLTEEEITTKTTDDLNNIRNLANLTEEDRQAIKRSEERLRELQNKLKKINRQEKKTIEKLENEVEKERTKLKNYLQKQKINREIKQSVKLSNFNEKTHSQKAASSFYWLKLKFLDKLGTNEYLADSAKLERVNKIFDTNINLDTTTDLMKYLLKHHDLENKQNLETLEDYQNFNSLLRDLRKIAREQLKWDEDRRRNLIFETRKQAYNEKNKDNQFNMSFFDKGAITELNKRINSIENINERNDFFSNIKKTADRLFLATAHPVQIARYIDKTTNGTWQTLIEKLKQSETSLQASKNERFRNLQNQITNWMGFDAKYLLHNKGNTEAYLAQKINEKGEKFIVKLNNGIIKELTRNEALMIYGYAIQDKGMLCLTSEIGNNFTRESVENLINNTISSKDKKLVEILSKDLSSKDLDIARVYARQNNKIYNNLENYFPLYASQGSFQALGVDASGQGLRTTLHNDTNYVNKNFTKARTRAVYALKLDLWNNYIRGVDSQERYIYQSDWVRDAQNWISPRGMGNYLTREKGKVWTDTIKNLINDIAEPQRKKNELNNAFQTIFSNMMTANLMFNTVSAIKQVGAWFAVFTDPDFKLSSFAKAIADLTFRHKETVENISKLNPDIDSQRGKGLDINERFEVKENKRGLDTFKEWGLKMADFMDLQGRYVVWQSAYQSYIDTYGITDKNGNLDSNKMFEATRKANRIIEETQNTTKRSQLASIQQPSFLGSEKLAYSNSTFQYLNKFYDAIHLAKNKDYKGVVGNLSLIFFNGAFMTLLSGVLFKPKDKDKDKEIAKRFTSDIIDSFIPLYSNFFRDDNTSVYSLKGLSRKMTKVIKDIRENEDTQQTIIDVFKTITEASKPFIAGPQVEIDRLIKGITDKESITLDKKVINTLINLILGTGFYNNIRGR